MKSFVLLFLACFITTVAFADGEIGLISNTVKKKKRKPLIDKNRLIVGGGLGGGSIQSGYTLSVTPSLGYRITDRFHAGVNFGYFFSRQKIPTDNLGSYYMQKFRVLSPALYARYFPLDFLFLQINPELNLLNEKQETYYATQDQTLKEKFRVTAPSFLVGGGYAQRLGGSSYMMMSVMYDLAQNPNSPYRNQKLIFGGGLALGLFGGR